MPRQRLPEYGVIVCKRCHYAVVPAQVNGHIQNQHPSITKDEWVSMVQTVAVSPNTAETPEDVRISSREEAAIKGLPIYQDGLRCIYETADGVCNYVCRELTGIQRHCRSQHGWKNPRRHGRPQKDHQSGETSQMWVKKQPCQRLFHDRRWPQYIAVRVGGRPINGEDEDATSQEERAEQGKTMLEALFRRFEEGQEREGENERCRYEPNP